jgi:hypothetical protein
MAQIGRTHRSVEFKHQNISAVLDELGMPWIPGYIPKRNSSAPAKARCVAGRCKLIGPAQGRACGTPGRASATK